MKPKREITLGEMQDACSKPMECKKCLYFEYCPVHQSAFPSSWNLTDPPRFTEAQMALLRALWELGARSIVETRDGLLYVRSENGNSFARFNACIVGINDGETLDLAELFGTLV